MFEDYEKPDVDFDDPDCGGVECMSPGCFDECMFDHPEKNCQCWKQCKAGTL